MSAYYNENDPDAAGWLVELIRRGLIATASTQAPLVGSASDQEEHDRLGIAPKPSPAILSLQPTSTVRCVHGRACEQHQGREPLHTPHKPLEPSDCASGTCVGLTLAVASPLCAAGRSPHAADCANATLALSGRSAHVCNHQSMFSFGLHSSRRRTVFRTPCTCAACQCLLVRKPIGKRRRTSESRNGYHAVCVRTLSRSDRNAVAAFLVSV